MYYHVCPFCGANLDPGEPCDCGKKENPPAEREARQAGMVVALTTSKVSQNGGKIKYVL